MPQLCLNCNVRRLYLEVRLFLLLSGLKRKKKNYCQLLSFCGVLDCSLKSFYSLPVYHQHKQILWNTSRAHLCYFSCYLTTYQEHSEHLIDFFIFSLTTELWKDIKSHLFLFFEGHAVVMLCTFSLGVQNTFSHLKIRILE